jgi:hypothetical protein
MSQGLPIVGLAFVDGQLWLARENGSVEGPGGLSIQLDPDPIGLVCEQGQLWVWGRKRLSWLDAEARILKEQPADPCHTLCQRNGLVWTASHHEVCCYRLLDGHWERLCRFAGLPGSCLSFDVSPCAGHFLRIWPGQGNRWHVAIYDALSGELQSEFKRGALWLQAVFSPDKSSLMVAGWSARQLTALSFSGGHCSQKHHLIPCGWAGPIYPFDGRVVAICQGGLHSYQCGSFPRGNPEYACSQGYENTSPWVIPVGSKWREHSWYKRYVEYACCQVTAVASSQAFIAVGHQDGTLQIHNVLENAAYPE